MQIEVMYADQEEGLFRRLKVALEDVETLPRDGVLALVVSHEGKLVGRAWGRSARDLPEGVARGTDYFAFVETVDGAWFIDCWDEEELTHRGRSISDPCNVLVLCPAPPRRHRGEKACCFRGIHLPTEDWKEALRQVDQFMVAAP